MQEGGLLRCSLAEASSLGPVQGLPSHRLCWALQWSGVLFTHGICRQSWQKVRRGGMGQRPHCLWKTGNKREGAQGHPARWRRSQIETQAIWLPVWLCGRNLWPQEPARHKKRQLLPHASIFKEPRNPNQELAGSGPKPCTLSLIEGGWVLAALKEEGLGEMGLRGEEFP